MRERYHKLIRVALASVALTSAVCAVAFGQAAVPNVTLDLKDVDVRSAIDTLFRGTGRNFAIEGEVQGTISTLSVKDVPFETALKGLARAAGLTYRIDEGMYLIQKKQAVVEAAPVAVVEDVYVDDTFTEEAIIDKVPLSHTGASELLDMMSGNTNNNNSGYGGWGGNNNNSFGGGGWGGNNSFGGGSFGGNNSFGGGSFGGGNYGGGSFGGGNYGGGNYGGGNFGGGNYGGRPW